MTKQSKTVAIVIALLVIASIAGIVAVMRVTSGPAARTVTVDSNPTTRKADSHSVSAMLGQLDLMRQSALDADIPEESRKPMLAMIDDTHAKIRAALDSDALTADARDEQLKQLRGDFSRSIGRLSDSMTVNQQNNFLWVELDLLSRRRLLPLMIDKLNLTEAQHQTADAAFMEMSVILHAEPAGGMPNEKCCQAMLTCREKLHALLTPDQRTKFDQALHDEQQKRQSTNRTVHTGTTFRMSATTTTTTKPAG